MRGGFRWVISGNEGAQLHIPPSQRLEPFKTFQKSLSCRYRLQPSRAAEAVSRRHVTTFNRLRRLSPGPVQSRADVASEGNGTGHSFGVRLMVTADDRVGSQACLTQCAAEEGFGTGAVSFVP